MVWMVKAEFAIAKFSMIRKMVFNGKYISSAHMIV